MRKAHLVSLLGIAVACLTAPRAETPRLFEFRSHFWVNLHHFARAAARGMPAPGELGAEERRVWDEGIAFYKPYSERSLIHDDGMVRIKEALRVASGETSLDGADLEPALKSTLERLAPVYRKHWWPAHDARNRAWIEAARPLIERHGPELSRRVAQAYGEAWPAEPIPVDLSVSAGPDGAYTTSPPTHVTIASTDRGYEGLAALEMVFHEASHAWGKRLFLGIAKAAEARKKSVPRQLWHAVLFYTAGESTRRTLEAAGIRDHVEYAARGKLYSELCGEGCRERVAEHWNPRLDGRTSIEAALDALVAAWPDP